MSNGGIDSPPEMQDGPPYTKGRKSTKKEVGCSRLGGGRFNKQGNIQMRLVLGATRWVNLCTHPPES